MDYAGNAGCPDPKAFEDLVSARLGYDPFREGATENVLVHIAPRSGGLEGRIEWRDSTGRWAGDQSLRAASNDCRHLVRALAAALAVQIQLLATTRPGAVTATANPKDTDPLPETSAQLPVPPTLSAPIVPDQPPAAPDGPESPVRGTAPELRPVFAVGAGASVGFGMSSSPVLLGRVLGSLAWQHVFVELAAEASTATTTRRADGAGFSQQHLLASVAACASLTRWSACLLGKGGEVRMAGESIDHPTSAVVPLVEAGARIGIVQRLGRHFLVDAHVDGLANVIRWTATLDQIPVWTAPRLSGVAGIDASVRFR
jgi:hypothetical protein